MHILFLSDNFPPEVNAPASRTLEHCREWVKAGHRVTIVTCVPNFPKGRVFDGYKNRLWQREEVDGIRVIRVWSYITSNEGFIKRILDYQSFMLSATIAGLFVRNVDVVVGTSPQFFTACASWVLGMLKNIPWIFELRDLWPESIKAVGAMNDSIVLRWLEKLELFLYRKASRIVSVTHAFKAVLVRRGVPAEKIDVVTNGVDTSRFAPMPKDGELEKSLDLQDKFVVGYIGTHGMAHALETLLDAAARLQTVAGGDIFRFIFLGDGARKRELQKRANDLGLHNVLFLDSVTKDQVARYWSLLDVAVIHLRRTELFTTVIPSKLFECMGMGIPVLHGVQGESADIVSREDVGLVFEPENSEDLLAGLWALYERPALYETCKQNGLSAASRYDRRQLALSMLESIAKVVKK